MQPSSHGIPLFELSTFIFEQSSKNKKNSEDQYKCDLNALDKLYNPNEKLIIEKLYKIPKSSPENEYNRYFNIIPYSETRVKLIKNHLNKLCTDYCNASLISKSLTNSPKTDYIATQAPLRSTISHFYHMCIQQNVNIIIMLTPLAESDRYGNQIIKAEQYWTDVNQQMEIDHTLSIHCIECKHINEYLVIRRLILKNELDNKFHLIIQFHLTNWSDHKSSNFESFEALMTVYRRYRNSFENGDLGIIPPPVQLTNLSSSTISSPVVVHCSAGIGRTGTFCAIDIIIDQLLHQQCQPNSNVNVYQTVSNLRRARLGMVQTLSQYKFIWEFINYSVKSELFGLKNRC